MQDKLQKEVYGLGYPSLPVLSVAEFYDQRVREGWFPPAGSGRALQVKLNIDTVLFFIRIFTIYESIVS